MDDLANTLERVRANRVAQARSAIGDIVLEMSPAPAELRRLASYVNLDEIRRIEDENVLSERFSEIERVLSFWADNLEDIKCNKIHT